MRDNGFHELEQFVVGHEQELTNSEREQVRATLIRLFQKRYHGHVDRLYTERDELQDLRGNEPDPADQASRMEERNRLVKSIGRLEVKLADMRLVLYRLEHDPHWDECAHEDCGDSILPRLLIGRHARLCTMHQDEVERRNSLPMHIAVA